MIRRILAAIARFLSRCVALPFRLLQSVFGGSGPVLPPQADVEAEIDGEADALRDELRAPARITPPEVRTLGEEVHGYAAAEDRAAYDLSLVPEHVAVTLLSMDERHLQVLAAAGPEACGRWALGLRSGIVGLPSISATTPAEAREPRHAPAAEDGPRAGPQLRLAA